LSLAKNEHISSMHITTADSMTQLI